MADDEKLLADLIDEIVQLPDEEFQRRVKELHFQFYDKRGAKPCPYRCTWCLERIRKEATNA